MNTTESIAALSFEECYDRLEQVISTLEAGELALDKAIALYEEGMRLAASCGQKLDAAQVKVTQLLATSGAVGNDEQGALDADAEADGQP
jgi:exodeoxyribonuclease VII small subunit